MKDSFGLFEKIETPLAGCFEIVPVVRSDVRGGLVKTFHAPAFAELGLETKFAEEFHTISHKDVVRAMHFQLPPEDYVKLAYCASGKVFAAALDLRKNSPTYKKFHTLELDGAKGNSLYLPRGFAFGYAVLTESVVVYKTTTTFSAKCDTGVLWNSCGIDWAIENPILADKDKTLPTLAEFDSPF